MDTIKVHTNDKLIRFDDNTLRYSASYGESWDFDTSDEFEQWAEDEGMILDDDVIEFLE